MSRKFTHYWSNRTWIQQEKHSSESSLLNHIAGNLFGERDIGVGDEIYVVTVIKGKLYLCGKLIIGKICDVDEAARDLDCKVDDLWEASEHIIASAATSTNFHFEVPLEVTQRLRFKSGKDLKPLLFSSPNYLDQQTLRGIRELNSESASELDKLLPPLINLSDLLLTHHPHSISDEEVFPDEIFSSQIYYEGATKQIRVNVYERNAQARKKCIAHHGVSCSVCKFNFKEFYGEIGEDYIHVHHLKPLSEIGEEYELDPIQDLRPLCPNCHAMLHRSKNVHTIEALQQLLVKRLQCRRD